MPIFTIDIKSDITLKEINDTVYTAGIGYKKYKLFGVVIYTKNYTEKLFTSDKKDKDGIGFNKKK